LAHRIRGEIGWKNVNWEPIVIEEGYELKTVLLSNITVLKLEIRHTNIKYDKHEFKLVEQNSVIVLAKTETIPTTITSPPTSKTLQLYCNFANVSRRNSILYNQI